MKKILLYFSFLIICLFVCGCQLNNTPTKKVEGYLNNYKTLNNDVLTQLDTTINSDTIMLETQKKSYTDILKKQYQDLTYTIKDEVVNGDKATVTVEIEVYDFYKLTNDADTYYATQPDEFKDESGNLVQSKYIDYKLEKMKDYKERVKYTIDFQLTKVDKTWIIDNVTEETRQKIHGLYRY